MFFRRFILLLLVLAFKHGADILVNDWCKIQREGELEAMKYSEIRKSFDSLCQSISNQSQVSDGD